MYSAQQTGNCPPPRHWRTEREEGAGSGGWEAQRSCRRWRASVGLCLQQLWGWAAQLSWAGQAEGGIRLAAGAAQRGVCARAQRPLPFQPTGRAHVVGSLKHDLADQAEMTFSQKGQISPVGDRSWTGSPELLSNLREAAQMEIIVFKTRAVGPTDRTPMPSHCPTYAA